MFAEINKELAQSLPFVLSTMGSAKAQKPIFRPFGFETHQIIWVTGGTGLFTLNGERMELEAGEGVFMRAGVPHSYEGESFDTSWCTFFLSEKVLDYIGIGNYLRFSVPTNLESETEQLITFANGESNALTRSSAGYQYVTEFFSAILANSEKLSSRIRNFLEQNYSQPLSLQDLSQRLDVDRFSLCRIYKKERGTTIMNDLLRIRLAKAKRFLKYGNESVTEISAMCGFENPCYFIKRFREQVGCTPSQYRCK